MVAKDAVLTVKGLRKKSDRTHPLSRDSLPPCQLSINQKGGRGKADLSISQKCGEEGRARHGLRHAYQPHALIESGVYTPGVNNHQAFPRGRRFLQNHVARVARQPGCPLWPNKSGMPQSKERSQKFLKAHKRQNARYPNPNRDFVGSVHDHLERIIIHDSGMNCRGRIIFKFNTRIRAKIVQSGPPTIYVGLIHRASFLETMMCLPDANAAMQ